MDNNSQQQQITIPEKKVFKGKITFISGSLLIYTAIMFAVVFGVMFAIEIFEMFRCYIQNIEFDVEAFTEKFSETDMGMGLSVIAGCIFLWLFNIKRIKLKEVFRPGEQKMTPLKFIMILSVLMCIQFPISLFDSLFEFIMNAFGLTAQAAIESSKAGSTTISMMLYAGFIGPFAEEFVYRGYTMQSLERTGAGKGYALVISSLLFGIMHANPTQSVYAFFAGLVFSYAAMEYGIIWSIVLHVCNNFVFGDVIVFIEKRIPEEIADIIDISLFIGFFVAGIAVIALNFKKVSSYIKENYRTEKKYYGWTFTNILFLLFIIANTVLAVTQIKPLE